MAKLRFLALILAIFMLGGCASVPTSGPVEYVPKADSGIERPEINVEAGPPPFNAPAELIIEGFLSAVESPTNNYATARQYLTEEASTNWRPTQILVYSAANQSIVVNKQGSATLTADIVGQISSTGHYQATSQPDFTLDFGLVQVDGQWRISNPGDSVIMSTQRFERSYGQMNIYFISKNQYSLVADQIFVANENIRADVAVQALIAGPDEALKPFTEQVLPPNATTSGAWVDNNHNAQVSLSSEVESLTNEQRSLMAAQLYWTLNELTPIEGIAVSVGGSPYSLPKMNQSGVLAKANIDVRLPESLRPDLYVVSANKILKLADGSANEITGSFSLENEQGIADLAINHDVAVIDGQRKHILLAKPGDSEAQTIFESDQLLAIQYDIAGNLWWASNEDEPCLYRYNGEGEPTKIQLPQLAGAKIISFSISSDLTRIAMAIDDGTEEHFGFSYLNADLVQNWHEIPLITEGGKITNISDIGFNDQTRLMILGEVSGDKNIWITDIDGANISMIGPLGQVEPKLLATMPGGSANVAALLTSDSQVLRYEEQYRWSYELSDVSAINFGLE